MAVRGIGVTDEAPGAGVAEYRMRERSVDGGTYCEQYLVGIDERVPSFVGMAGGFWALNAATPGGAKTALSNLAGSGVLVAVRSILVVAAGYNAANTTPVDIAVYKQANTASGGAGTLAKVSAGTGADAAETSNANVELRARHVADNGAGTAMTLTLGTKIAQMSKARSHTLDGAMWEPQPTYAVPSVDGCACTPEEMLTDSPIILREGESVAVWTSGTAANQIAIVESYVWEEYLLP